MNSTLSFLFFSEPAGRMNKLVRIGEATLSASIARKHVGSHNESVAFIFPEVAEVKNSYVSTSFELGRYENSVPIINLIYSFAISSAVSATNHKCRYFLVYAGRDLRCCDVSWKDFFARILK